MVVAITPRHFRDLAEVTGTADAVRAVESALRVDFTKDGDRYRHRRVLDGLFGVWFAERNADEAEAALAETSVVYERYRTFAQVACDPKVMDNPMFGLIEQPRIGSYLAPTTPMTFEGAHPPARPAPANGDDTAHVLAEYLNLTDAQIADLHNRGVVRATTRPTTKDTE